MIILVSDRCLRRLLASSQPLQCVCRPRTGYGHLWVAYEYQDYCGYDNDGHCNYIMIILFDNGREDFFHDCFNLNEY